MRMRIKASTLLRAGLLAVVACSDAEATADSAVYRVDVGNESFHVTITDAVAVLEAERRIAEAGGASIVAGTLARGDGGFNQPWSWHLLPETVRVVDVSMELCDGAPSMVEEDVDYWVDTVKQFCPWTGKLAARVPEAAAALRLRGAKVSSRRR